MNKERCNGTKNDILHSTVPAPRSPALHRIDHFSEPVLENVRHVADGVAVRDKIPAPRVVAGVIVPDGEDEVGD